MPAFSVGSRAKGTAKQYSDLDLAVDAGEKIPLIKLHYIKSEFEDSELVFKVEIIDLHRVSEQFRQHIQKDLKPL